MTDLSRVATPVICWGDSGGLSLAALPPEEVQRVADRWCGAVHALEDEAADAWLRLDLPEIGSPSLGQEPRKIRVRFVQSRGLCPPEFRVGPDAVVLGVGREPDKVRFGTGREPSKFEVELVIDLGVNHLLARQGLPVLHGCAFELDGASILGLGESYSGKTTVSVAALRAGGRFASDDVVLTVPGDNVYSLLPVRSYGWLRGRTREIVPTELQDKMIENQEDGQPRWVLDRKDGGESFIDRTEPAVIWALSVDRRLNESRIEPIDHGRTFAALIGASSPIYLSRHCPEIRDKLIPVFQQLCVQCRGYRVRLGRRLLEDPVGEMRRLVGLSS